MDVNSPSAERLAAAMGHHRAGNLIEAERLYRLLCNAEPRNARALHLLGLVTHQMGRRGAAALIGRAVALDPAFAEAHNDHGVILAAEGNLIEALACFERALMLKPNFNDARNNLGRWSSLSRR
jgi:protein O-GlcNAc transferase